LQRLKAIVSGRVQGVGFRYFVIRNAQSIGGIGGYAKNLPDGTVEVLAEGEKDKLERLVQALHQGPPVSKVDDVHADWSSTGVSKYSGFGIEY